MNGITHKQARRYMLADLDGLLTDSRRRDLETHLRECGACRAEAESLSTLTARLQSGFHARWDTQNGPSDDVMANIHLQTRRIVMSNRINFALRVLAGITALIVLVVTMNYILLNTQNQAASSVTKTPDISNQSELLRIDPNSCKPFSDSTFELQPPNELYGYELIQGTSFVDGDFSYKFWLYCDPTLEPDEKENLNAIAGLGIFSSWRYDGPNVEGSVEYHYEFEPNVPFGGTGLNGPFNKATSSGARFGIDISKTTLQTYIQQGIPIQFRVVIDSPRGHNGAILSFNLESTEDGYKIANLRADSLSHSYIATPGTIPSPKPTAQYTLPLITLQTPSVPGEEPRLVFFVSEPGKFEAWVPVAGDIVEYTIMQTLFGKSVKCSGFGLSLNSASVTIRYCDLDSDEVALHSSKAILEEVRGAVEKEFRLRVDPKQVELVDDTYPTLSLSGNEDMTSIGANDGTFKARIILAQDRVYFIHMSVYYIDWCYCRHQIDQVVDTFYVDPYMSIPFEPTPTP